MHLQDLDVEVLVERPGHALDQRGQQIDAEAHIAGFDHDGARRGGRDRGLVCRGEAGRADDMDQALAGDELGETDRGLRDGEIDQPVGAGQQRRELAQHRDVIFPEPRKLARVAADHGGAGRLDGARQPDPGARRDGLDQRASHAPAGASHDQPHVGHGSNSRCGARIAGRERIGKQPAYCGCGPS
jgi:hypothetical protein